MNANRMNYVTSDYITTTTLTTSQSARTDCHVSMPGRAGHGALGTPLRQASSPPQQGESKGPPEYYPLSTNFYISLCFDSRSCVRMWRWRAPMSSNTRCPLTCACSAVESSVHTCVDGRRKCRRHHCGQGKRPQCADAAQVTKDDDGETMAANATRSHRVIVEHRLSRHAHESRLGLLHM